MLTSLLFLTINFVVITIYFSIKNSALINPFKSYIGLGDLLFLLAVVPFFSFRNYLLFFVTGMIFSLILYSLFKKKYLAKTIPLAGYLSIYLIGLITFNLFIQHNL